MSPSLPSCAPTAGVGSLRSRLLVAAAAALVAFAFTWNVRHWWFLNDDAFITFRYARHLVEGHGLVWNPGERVEGYSEFLFALLIAGGIALGAAPEVFANVLLVGAGAGILVAITIAGARRFGWTSPFTWLAPLALALHRVFTAWSTSGMAMQLFALFVVLGYLRFLRERDEPSRSPLGSSLLLALAALTRPEGALAIAIAGAFFAFDVVRRRRGLRELLLWCAPWILLIGAHVLWRRAYYGFWLPNTFHAKVGGFYGAQGLRWLALFADDFKLQYWLPFLAFLVLRRERRFEQALLLTWCAALLAWLWSIGGDWLEFRFWCPVLPFLLLLLADGLHAFAATSPFARGLALVTAGALLATTHFGSHRPEAREIRDWTMSIEKMASYTERRTRDGKFLRELVDAGLLPADLRIAVGGAGVVPWYSRLYTIDYLGLNDVAIAHRPLDKRGMIGHERLATLDELAARGVALLDAMNAIVWRRPRDELPRTAGAPYVGVPLRCLEVGDRFLLFATTLDEASFRRVFGRLEPVF